MDTSHDLGNVAALLELCDAQQESIERLHKALSEHEQIEADRHMLKRMLAHELRTPLAAVIGALHLMDHPQLPPERVSEMRERALRQANHLNEMIDDILNLADPHEASVARADQEVVSLADIVADVCETTTGVVSPDRLIVDVEADVKIRTIPSRVRQILVNLVVNAAKYSPPDEVISLAALRLSEHAVFEVVDRGPGIAPEAVDALFEPYRRGDGAEGPGVGLGLYLARNLARSLGGTIELLPRETGGTLARVSLPQKRLEDTLPTAAPVAPRHVKVLSSPPARTLQSR